MSIRIRGIFVPGDGCSCSSAGLAFSWRRWLRLGGFVGQTTGCWYRQQTWSVFSIHIWHYILTIYIYTRYIHTPNYTSIQVNTHPSIHPIPSIHTSIPSIHKPIACACSQGHIPSGAGLTGNETGSDLSGGGAAGAPGSWTFLWRDHWERERYILYIYYGYDRYMVIDMVMIWFIINIRIYIYIYPLVI